MENVDVIIPFHRVDELLLESINAVENSVGINTHIILSNDSQFENVQLTSSLKKYTIFKSGHFSGFPNAVNSVRHLLQSSYTSIVASDDLINPQKFTRQIAALKDDYDVSICKFRKINLSGKTIKSINPFPSYKKYHPSWLLFGPYGGDGTWIAHTDWWLNFVHMPSGPFHDWELALELLPKARVAAIDEPLISYRMHDKQTSRSFDIKSIDSLDSFFQKWCHVNDIYEFPKIDKNNVLAISQPWYVPRNSEINETQIQNWLNEWYKRCETEEYDLISSIFRKWLYLRFKKDLNLKTPIPTGPFIIEVLRLIYDSPNAIKNFGYNRAIGGS